MPTTTIRMPEALKQRITNAAKRTGTTPHALILKAVVEKAEQEERRAAFEQLADERYAAIVANGETIPWEAMKDCLESRLSGVATATPAPRKLGS
ncbi:CopG family ribbon-helix-helix protein [Pelovirga terrestris]|uniref:CopG family transcriptional regulator n=1 Tax=Pelovirga terrestris TaxID=2771352 RepID=A0A8J6QV57_9BACT|nr:DUF6290 family protein [Pelovirga terrestris]MBD1401270.1 CopG family transcriptional regulator [Pelovirga terrestris]